MSATTIAVAVSHDTVPADGPPVTESAINELSLTPKAPLDGRSVKIQGPFCDFVKHESFTTACRDRGRILLEKWMIVTRTEQRRACCQTVHVASEPSKRRKALFVRLVRRPAVPSGFDTATIRC